MDTKNLYDEYLIQINRLISNLGDDTRNIEKLDKEERNEISSLENMYSKQLSQIEEARRTVQQQYKEAREVCLKIAGIKSSVDRKPEYTDKTWQEAIRIQERFATSLKSLVEDITRAAVLKKQQEKYEEQKAQARLAAEKAEQERKKAEEELKRKEEEGRNLLEKIKNKYRRSTY